MSTLNGFTRAAIHPTRSLAWRAASTAATTHPPSQLFPTTQTQQQQADYLFHAIFELIPVARQVQNKFYLF
jgi:hypothetical protein